MAVPVSHYLGSLIERIAGSDQVEPFLQQINIDAATGLLVEDSFIRITPEATVFTVDLSTIHHRIDLPAFPGSIGTLDLRIGDERGQMSLSVASDWSSVEFESLHLVFSAASNLLRPLDPAANSVEVSFGARITVYRDLALEIVPDIAVDMGPARLGDTDIVLHLEGLRPEFNLGFVPQSLDGDLLNGEFRGVYVNGGYLHVLNDYPFGDEYGLQVNFKHFAFTSAGISGRVHSFWEQGISTSLFGIDASAWELQLKSIDVEIRNSFPQTFRIDAAVKVPLLPTFVEGFLSLDFGETGKYKLSVANQDPVQFDFDFGSLRFESISADGAFSTTDINLTGTCRNINLVSDALSVNLAQSSLAIRHSPESDRLSITINQLDLGSFVIPDASLVIELTGEGDQQAHEVYVEGEIRWEDLAARITLPEYLPVPPDDAIITLKAHWEQQADSSYQFRFDLHIVADDADAMWSFIPEAFRPEVPRVKLILTVITATDSDIQVEVGGTIDVLLPQLPAGMISEQIELTTGNDLGIVSCQFAIDSDGNLSLSTSDLLGLQISLPGGIADAPFIETRLTEMAVEAAFSTAASPADAGSAGSGSAATTSIRFAGDFAFRPLVPSAMPFAANLNALLGAAGFSDVRGDSRIALTIAEDGFDIAITGEFDQFGIDIDVFHLLSSLASGGTPPSGSEIDVDFDISFHLVGFDFNLGNLGNAGTAETSDYYFGFGLNVECTMTGLPPLRAALKLSSTEFSFGLENLTIPFEIPKYPISMADLNSLRGSGQIWTAAATQTVVEGLDQEIYGVDTLLADEALTDRDRFRHIRTKSFLELKKLMLQLVMQIHGKLDSSGHAVYQKLVEADTLFHDTLLSLLHVDTELKLNFPQIKFRIPFDDPSGIGISGSGRIIGFADDDPLKALGTYTFSLGLSSEYIIASIESDGGAIPVPSLGTAYDDGSLAIDKLMIGYGYSKNSIVLDFAGQLVIPSKLQDDLDTSSEVGVGVRIPRYNKLAFKIDLIPVTIVKVTVVIPIPRFDLDLRTPNAPALVSTARCEPYWDGFEVIARDVLHVGLKRVAFSPFFGFTIAPNVKFDGDWKLGNDLNGATLIIDDALVLTGTFVGTYFMPVPFFADPYQPYFKNVCVNLRIAGFELNFNLQRPFPSTSPMTALEAFGLISDPMMEIDPDGALANTIRFTLSDAYLRVPDFALRMFPDAANFVNRVYGFTLNLGTLIGLTQSLVKVAQPAIEQARNEAADGSVGIGDALADLPQTFDPWDWVTLLPPELRKFRTGGQIAGFEASACLVIASAEEAEAGLKNKAATGEPFGMPALTADPAATGKTAIRRPGASPLYKPTSGVQFDTMWTGHGDWHKSTGGIVNLYEAGADNYLVYQKDAIPADLYLSLSVTLSGVGVDSRAGALFCFVDPDNHYRLTVGTSAAGKAQITLSKMSAGQHSTLLQEALPVIDNHQGIQLEVTSYETPEGRCFEIVSSRDYPRRSGDEADAQRIASRFPRAYDRANHLQSGKVGLINQGVAEAHFEGMLVYRLVKYRIPLMAIDPESAQKGFNVNLTDRSPATSRLMTRNESFALFDGIEFDKFDETHLGLLPSVSATHDPLSDSAVFLGAFVKVFGGQRLRFFGRLYADGSFALVSEAERKPLSLSVHGIPVHIPFGGYANLSISGRQRRRGYYGCVAASGYFRWAPIPNIVEMSVGSAKRPARLKLYSDGKFQIVADVDVSLFNGAGHVVDGTIDISERMAKFGGRLSYRLGSTIPGYAFAGILELDISGKGEVVSLDQYQFVGRGDVRFLGDTFSDVEVRCSERYASFDLHFRKSRNAVPTSLEERYPILKSCDIDIKGGCRVNLRRTVRPEFVLRGSGEISALGATISGAGEIKSVPASSLNSKHDYFAASMAGNVFWQNRKWLGGEISIGSKGLRIAGTTHFGLKLSPDDIPGIDVSIASLFLDIQLEGELNLDAAEQSLDFMFKGKWSLGIVLAEEGESQPRQILSLASSTFSFSSNHSIFAQNEFRMDLIDIDGFKFVPLKDFSIPIPDITLKSESEIARIGKTRYVTDSRFGPPVTTYKSAVQFKTALGTFGMEDLRPHFNEALPWVDGSVQKIYSDYYVDFGMTEFPINLNQFSSVTLSLTMQNSRTNGFPIRLKLSTDAGADYFP